MVNVNRLEIVFTNPLQISYAAAGYVLLTISYDRFTITTKGDYVMYTLPVDHTVQMQIAYVDAGGNPATVDGDVTWASSDATIANVITDPQDSMKCRVVPQAVGQFQVTATADADLGQGVKNLVTLADITVVAGEAVAGTITPVGEPEPKP